MFFHTQSLNIIFTWGVRIVLGLCAIALAVYLTRPWWRAPVEEPAAPTDVRQVTPRPPLVEGPGGQRDVPFADSTGAVEEIPVDTENPVAAAITVERDSAEAVRLTVEPVQTLFPDFTRRPRVRVGCVGGACAPVTVVYPPPPIISLTPRFTVGLGVDGTLAPGVLVNASPLRLWGVRLGGFAYASLDRIGAGPSAAVTVVANVDLMAGYDLLHQAPTVGVTVHF